MPVDLKQLVSGVRMLLKHVQSLLQQVFMFLDSPTQTVEVSFRVKNSDGSYMLYAGSGKMKCFECVNVGRKCFACPHKQQVAVPSSNVVSGFVLAWAAADTNIASVSSPWTPPSLPAGS